MSARRSGAAAQPVITFALSVQTLPPLTVPLPAARYRYFDVSLQTVSGGTAHSDRSVLRGPTGG
jgi:hypothetical protein